MRVQQILSVDDCTGIISSHHFQQLFSAHGTTMIFFVGMGVIFGLMNLIVPLQIGARDVAFPFLNALSFWLFAAAAGLLNLSLVVGQFSEAGWLAYPPLSSLEYSKGVGVDYWIWTLQISGVGSLMSGINFLVTILKMRCPGMTLMRMPLFTWCAFASALLILFAFPILTATLGLLALDRILEMRLFTSDFGGNAMMYVNLIWAWGHPEVYILVLPAFGIFSEVVSTFSQKKLFGYASMVLAIVSIAFLSFLVWLHHFFTMGGGAHVNAFFGITTMLIAIPTGVKVFNWLFTQFRGRIQFTVPMLWFLAFVINFSIGGMTGVLMSLPAVDFQVHNSLFLVAHFHSMIIPGVVFAFFAGLSYWFPKIAGFKLDDRLGRYAVTLWSLGFLIAFMPLYTLGLMGATRRLDHYDSATGWQPFFMAAGIGVVVIACGVAVQLLQLYVSYRQRHENKDTTGDPWKGRTLEWASASPPPVYNFAILPRVTAKDAFEWIQERKELFNGTYEDIHLPKNTGVPLLIAGFAAALGFALVWFMWWLAALSFVGILTCLIYRLSGEDARDNYVLKAFEVEQMEREYAQRN
jgi:cytochrome o ubiquinol oxidase subunit 1